MYTLTCTYYANMNTQHTYERRINSNKTAGGGTGMDVTPYTPKRSSQTITITANLSKTQHDIADRIQNYHQQLWKLHHSYN